MFLYNIPKDIGIFGSNVIAALKVTPCPPRLFFKVVNTFSLSVDIFNLYIG